jgi:peptidoglycan/LPS O-acetylase OafA/YrhL
MLATSVASVFLMPPSDLVQLGKFLALNSVMLGNLPALHPGGYFALAHYASPLKHLWSIAVEEQFYLLFPLTLLLIARFAPQRRVTLLALGALLSLAGCIGMSYVYPVINFYIAPSRAWELLLGALLAVAHTNVGRNAASRQVPGLLAAMILIACIPTYGKAQPYPGAYTLLPCIATALLLHAGGDERSWAHRALSSTPLVFIGRISYSLYLWHLPFLSLFIFYNLNRPNAMQRTLLLTGIFLTATASWAWIEQPFRRALLLANRRSFLGVCAAAAILVGVSGSASVFLRGWPQRFLPELQELFRTATGSPASDLRCAFINGRDILEGRICHDPAPRPGAAPVIFWGDSHMQMLQPGFSSLAQSEHIHWQLGAFPACLPLIGVDGFPLNPASAKACANFNEAMIREVWRSKPQVVVLGGRWSMISFHRAPGIAANADKLRYGLESLLRRLPADAKICVVMDVPSLPFDGRHSLAMAFRKGQREPQLALSRQWVTQQQRELDVGLQQVAASGRVRLVDLKDALCTPTICHVIIGGKSMYRDGNHLSSSGAQQVITTFHPCFADIRRQDN